MKYYVFNLEDKTFHGFDSLSELGRYLGLSVTTLRKRFLVESLFMSGWCVVSDVMIEHRSGRGNPNFGKGYEGGAKKFGK